MIAVGERAYRDFDAHRVVSTSKPVAQAEIRLPVADRSGISPWQPVIESGRQPAKRRAGTPPGRSTAGRVGDGTTGRSAELKENIKRQWWQAMVTGREDVVGLDSSIILPREVWVASGTWRCSTIRSSSV